MKWNNRLQILPKKVSGTALILITFLAIHALGWGAVNQLDYLASIRKIDVHTHVRADEPFLHKLLEEDNYKYVTICTNGSSTKSSLEQRENARKLSDKYPRHYAWVTTFDTMGMFETGWIDGILKQLKEDFKNGAIGVKVWKNIGMVILKPNGEYLQLDDPMFKPIWDLIAKENKTLLAHMGEPIHAWMPTFITEDGYPRNYFAKHPEFSFYDKPDKPSYSDIVSAFDRVIRDNPDMRYVGAHLASLEFDVSELALRMDKYPNFAVEIGGRMRYLMWQSSGKVRAFFIKYQDRIMYGTDKGAPAGMTNDKQREERAQEIRSRNTLFAQYLATDDEIPFGDIIRSGKPVPEAQYSVQAIALPKSVLKKVYYDNALVWFPGSAKAFQDPQH